VSAHLLTESDAPDTFLALAKVSNTELVPKQDSSTE
jgi:hypothetical protein